MESKIGKIYDYSLEKGYGIIVTNDINYVFLKKDLETTNIKKGDIVKFSGEVINNNNRAFFVRSFVNEDNISKEKKK